MRIPFFTTLALAIAPLAAAMPQNASADLFLRQSGEMVQAGVKISIKPTWYLFHTDKGGKDVVGTDLTFEWSGGDLDWQGPVMPEHKVGRADLGIEGFPAYDYNYHTGTVTAWFQAEGTPDLEDLRLSINGQTCSQVTGNCVLFKAPDLAATNSAKPEFWSGFPAAFPAPAGTAQKTPTESPAEGPAADGKNRFGWVPSYDEGRIDIRYRLLTTGEKVRAIFEFDVEPGYHAYHGPTLDDISMEEPTAAPTVVTFEDFAVQWEDPVYPKPHRGHGWSDSGDEIEMNTHEGTWVIVVEGILDEGVELDEMIAIISGQVCDDSGCVNVERTLEAEIEEVDSLEERAALVAQPTGDENDPYGESKDKKQSSLLAFLGQAVFWAFFTLLMPCTYPMIPITISFFTKQAASRGGKVLPLALAYGAGIIAIFIVIGLVAAPVIIPFATHPVTNLVIGLLFVFFALTLFGFINLQPPQFMNKMAGKASSKGGYLGVFLMGATLVVTSFTCTAPFVGTLLASGAASGAGEGGAGILRIVLGMGVFGLVMATPFVFLSLVPGKMQALPKAGGWMNTLKVYMGFVEIAAALKFFSNTDIRWDWNILNNQVFLLAWILIFVIAGIYLLYGTLKKGGSKSPIQIGIGVLTLVFTGYMGSYLGGRPADLVMSAFLPGYHSEPLVKAFGDKRLRIRHIVVEDDLAAALQMAKEKELKVLLNFTGKV